MSTGVVYTDGPSSIVSGPESNATLDALSSEEILVRASEDNVAALLQTHPDYNANIEKWQKYEDCYEASDIYRFIYKHTRETPDTFSIRVRRGYYYNYVASVIDLFVAYLFHAPIERNAGNLKGDDLESIYTDANLSGDTYDFFLEEIAVFAQMHGHCGVLVDMPQVDSPYKSEEDRKKAKHRPYLVKVPATNIMDWELDKFGNFEWVKIEIVRPQGRDWKGQYDDSERFFLIWSKESWEEWKVYTEKEGGENSESQAHLSAKMINSGENPLGEVPLVIVVNEKCKTHQWMGLSAVRDIADINIAILNWASLGDEEIFERCLNVLVMERSEEGNQVTLSHHNALEYPAGTQPPQYLTPGVSPLELISKWINNAKEEIYRLAKLTGASGVKDQYEAKSGIAYAYEFNETNQSLAKKAESLEQAEKSIHKFIAKWMKKDWDGNVRYCKEFGVEDFATEIQMLAEARTTLSSDTAIKELEKKLASRLFARESQELNTKVKSEIDSGDARMTGFLESFNTVPSSVFGSKPKK